MHQSHVQSWSASRPSSVTSTGKLKCSCSRTFQCSIRARHAQAYCRQPQRQGMPSEHASLKPRATLHTSRNNKRMSAINALDTNAPAVTVSQEFVSLANDLADAAAKVTTKYFRSSIIIDNKADNSPVTEADRQAEKAMRDLIKERFPEHGIFGEELGMQQPSGDSKQHLWVLDPIDGTKSFITGKPVFGTLIALLQDGVPVLGVIDQPITKERWIGVTGQGTTLNGKPVHARDCKDISLAYLYATTPHMFSAESHTEQAFNSVRDAVGTPLYGCDCYAYGLLATGCVDLVVEADLKPYDYMALVPIVQEAGGTMTDWLGNSLTWSCGGEGYLLDSLPGEVVAAGSAVVHQNVLELLDWGKLQEQDAIPIGSGASS